jgi:TctA family transporter
MYVMEKGFVFHKIIAHVLIIGLVIIAKIQFAIINQPVIHLFVQVMEIVQMLIHVLVNFYGMV